jgi:CheY-like chemotaxis protein
VNFARVQPNRPKRQLAAVAKEGGPQLILVAEDEAVVREMVIAALERLGYRVMAASTGEEAVRLIDRLGDEIDLLLTDVVMPGMSGRELSKQLCAAHPQTKVLYLSGYTEDAIVHQGVLEPGTAFLQKPFTLQMLSRKVREVLSGECG